MCRVEACEQRWCPNHRIRSYREPETQTALSGNPEHRSFKAASFVTDCQRPPEDFITGWLRSGETRKGVWMGRPVGLAGGPGGAMYVTDDSAGGEFRVCYRT